MKELRAPLAAYGITPNSRILVLESQVQSITQQPFQSSSDSEEQLVIQKINSIVNTSIPELDPIYNEFMTMASHASTRTPELTRRKLQLNELLMQCLLKVDDVKVGSEQHQARKLRKEAVHKLQFWMDQVDETFQQLQRN
jgi:hypothetical protein